MPQKREIIDRLLKLAKVTHDACDNALEDGEDGTSIDRRDYDSVCEELNALDQLPDVPGEAADGWRKAEYWLAVADRSEARANQDAGFRAAQSMDPTRIMG